MHDYYTIIARAVSRLNHNTPATRQALFERIRFIHMDQLRVQQPSPSNSEIERARIALEDAIRKVEFEVMSGARQSREPAYAPTKPWADDHKLVGVKPDRQPISLGAPQKVKPPPRRDHPINRTGPVSKGSPQKSGLQNAFELAKGFLIEERPRERGEVLGPTPMGTQTAVEFAQEQSIRALEASGGKSADLLGRDAGDLAAEKAISTKNAHAKSRAFGQNAGKPNYLIPMQLLDQLIADAADQFALDSLKQDARALLKWLKVESADAIKLEHYALMARAFQQYLSEWQPAHVSTAELRPSSCALTDDIRAVFGRLLEREEAAVVFEKGLSGFAHIWVGLVIGLNFLGVVGLLIAEPTLWAGVAKVGETYSPFNVWTWTVQVLAVLPGLFAFAWLCGVRGDRLRRLQTCHSRVDPMLGLP
jgi:hypothetical protein